MTDAVSAMETTLNRRDYEDFLIRAYFGEQSQRWPLASCIARAYGDFNRTLHGIAHLPDGKELYKDISEWLIGEISSLSKQSMYTQDSFDAWHKTTCVSLQDKYKSATFTGFYIGHSQKWLNMVFKYVYTFGERRLSGFAPLYTYCHIPIDRLILERLQPLGFPGFGCAWSRVDDYEEYFDRQRWIRKNFKIPPLDVEFYAWQTPEHTLSAAMHERPIVP